MIADSTRRLLGNLFELKDLGPRELKGIADPTPVWAALRARRVGSRFDALHTTSLTALVGREEETELLLRRWSRAKTGEGQVVLLSGEAGIGKSRLTAALLECLAVEPHTGLRYFCSPQRADSALHPIRQTAGEIAMMLPEPDAAKAQAHFERATAIAREQHAKSWELRAAKSMARLWRRRGKRQQANDLLAPIYGWFTEGFDTLDLKQAKALLDELAQ